MQVYQSIFFLVVFFYSSKNCPIQVLVVSWVVRPRQGPLSRTDDTCAHHWEGRFTEYNLLLLLLSLNGLPDSIISINLYVALPISGTDLSITVDDTLAEGRGNTRAQTIIAFLLFPICPHTTPGLLAWLFYFLYLLGLACPFLPYSQGSYNCHVFKFAYQHWTLGDFGIFTQVDWLQF